MHATAAPSIAHARRAAVPALVALVGLAAAARVGASATPPIGPMGAGLAAAPDTTPPSPIENPSRHGTGGMSTGMDHATMDDGAMAHDGMDAHHSPEEALHMRMTDARPATHGDSTRLAAVTDSARRALGRYVDVAAAEADGYQLFLPQLKHQRVYHYTNYRNAFAEAFRFDPARPTSLLYEDGPGGRKVLTGVMYTAPARWSAEQLDARVPLSLAPWHQHRHWCLPPAGATARWAETHAGKPVFGPASPIADRASCDAVGCVYRERVFGWMVHVDPFARTPAAAGAFGHDHR